MNPYLMNAWYAAAWEEEIVGAILLARRLLDRHWVIYRTAAGEYVMLEDRCPHRFAPLHLGERRGDAIMCRYHGLVFGAGGQCVHNPYSDQLPNRPCVAAPPLLSRHGLVWFWPGDPALADPAAVPDFAFLVEQDVRRRQSRFEGHYELLVDNLMDLSHVDYLHRATFNTAGTHVESTHEVRDGEGGTIWNVWRVPRVKPFAEFEDKFDSGQPIDQLLEMRWDPPASMMLRISWMPGGSGPDAARHTMVSPHIITPETQSSSHYFWTCAPSDDAEAFARAVFEGEDKPMIEAVQSRMAGRDFWELQPLVLKGDIGAVRARRRLQRLQRAECGTTEPD